MSNAGGFVKGYYVTVTMANNEPQRVTETFKTEGEAWRWIRNDSVAWLNAQRLNPENAS
jgi:hypothetical protein